MKKHIVAFVFLIGYCTNNFATEVIQNIKKSSQELQEPSLKINVSNPDSSTLQILTALMHKIPTNKGSANFEINYTGIDSVKSKLQAQDSIDFVKIDDVYHYAFFKKRKNEMALGFENYFVINDFKSFKKNYLDNYSSDKRNLVFFGNGTPYPNHKLFLYDGKASTISFMIARSDSMTQSFAHSFISKFIFKIKDPSVGFGYYDTATQKWIEIASKEIKQFYVLKPYTLVFVGIWFVFLLLVFYRLGKKTNLLKTGIREDSSYSLSLTQFAFWTVIIFTSYFYLWMVNFELAKIPSSSLVLLGITTATTASSRTIDLKMRNKKGKKASNHFIQDLLTEGEIGYSVHRCQLVLVTLMFGLFYMVSVIRLQELPIFDESLLWLIGISSGTFVGIKSVESLKDELGLGKPAEVQTQVTTTQDTSTQAPATTSNTKNPTT